MKNKILKYLPLFITIVSVAVGLTIAFLSDIEQSGNNVFSAETLDLNLQKSGGSEATASWQAGNWSPGNEVEGELEFENNGSIPVESLLMSVEIEK